MSIFTPKNKSVFQPEEIEAFEAFHDKSTSKKSD